MSVASSRLLTLNGYVAFNLPRAVTGAGVLLLSGLAAAHAYVLITAPAPPVVLVGYLVALIVTCLIAASAMALGANPVVARCGWYLGSAVCVIGLVAYLASRPASLTGVETLTGRWDFAPGTFAMAFAAAFIALHGTVLSGINVAYPQRRHWYD